MVVSRDITSGSFGCRYLEQPLVENRIEVWNGIIAIDSPYARTTPGITTIFL
jgi:hypothetical protein